MFLREKIHVLSFFLAVGHHARGKVYGETVPQPLLPALMCLFFSHLPNVYLLVFRTLVRKIFPHIAVDVVSL